MGITLVSASSERRETGKGLTEPRQRPSDPERIAEGKHCAPRFRSFDSQSFCAVGEEGHVRDELGLLGHCEGQLGGRVRERTGRGRGRTYEGANDSGDGR